MGIPLNRKMTVQEVLDQGEIKQELDRHMRSNWSGIPEDFKPVLDLRRPHSFQDLTKIVIRGLNNGSIEEITLKELNFLYLYCFVQDFYMFHKYERATKEEREWYAFPNDLTVFRKFSHSVDFNELVSWGIAYKHELSNYIEITRRAFIYGILD